jgi:hypothetical protein
MWSIILEQPIKLDNGQILRTLEDVRLLLISIPSDLARLEKWQTLAALLVDVAISGHVDVVDLVSDQLRHALETPPYAGVRVMPEPKAPAPVRRRGAGRPRKKLVH